MNQNNNDIAVSILLVLGLIVITLIFQWWSQWKVRREVKMHRDLCKKVQKRALGTGSPE